jgi:hypothetical protein
MAHQGLRPKLVILGLTAGLVFTLASAAGAQTPVPSPALSPTATATQDSGCGFLGTGCLARLPQQIGNAIWSSLTNRMRQHAESQIREGLTLAMNALHTPDLFASPRIVELFLLCLAIVNGTGGGLIVLALCFGGLLTMFEDWTGMTAKVLIPRFLVAYGMANLGLASLAAGAGVSNFFVSVFAKVGPKDVQLATNRIVAANVPWVIGDAFFIVAMFLIAVSILRLIVLVILGVVSPFAQATWIFPQTENVAKEWWKAVTGLLLAPILQMLVMTIGVWVFFTGTSWFGGGAIVDAIMLLVLFGIEIAIPWVLLKRATRPTINTVAGIKTAVGLVKKAKYIAAAVA